MLNTSIKNVFICLAFAFSLTGCIDLGSEEDSSNGNPGVGGGTGGGGNGGAESTLRGSVGDGPITNATITVFDNSGAQVASTSSDDSANYEVTVPAGAAYPVTAITSDGLDIVTGTQPTFSMSSIALSDSADIANISPFSTFIVENAKTLPGGLNDANIAQATSNVISQLNFGLDAALVPNPITSPISDQNAAAIVKASEALGELIRRVEAALLNAGNTSTQDEIISTLSADLADGVIDGQGAGADSRIAATTTIISAQVLVETLTNTLQVNGALATGSMDNAISIVQPNTTVRTADVLITSELIAQTQVAIAAAQSIAPSQALIDTAAALSSLAANSTAASASAAVPSGITDALNQATTSVASASPQDLDNINETVRDNSNSGNTPAPTITLNSSDTNIDYNTGITLSWSSTNANSCSATGAWSGNKATSGSEASELLTSNTTFSLSCTGAGGQTTSSVSVTVGAPPTPSPVVSITAEPSAVSYNGSTTLNWSSTNASACTASENWSGDKNTSGSQTISSLTADSTFTLTCSGNGGSAAQTVNVSVAGLPAPGVTFTISSNSVEYGENVTLNWSTSNATGCSASGAWVGNKGTSGSEVIGPMNSTTAFFLSCTGPGGTTDRTRNLTVGSPPATPTLSLSASPSTVDYNGSSTLSWSSTDADSCSATGDWNGNRNTSGSETFDSLESDRTFTLTCNGDGGSVNRTVFIDVSSAPTPTVSLSASPTSIVSNGSTTLSWSSTNVDTCTASGGWSGSQSTSGSQTINSITSNSTFTLTCTGDGGSADQSVDVTVSATPAPTVSLSADPTSVANNGSTTLNWSSTNANTCSASGDWSGSQSTSGSQTINSITSDSTFTLACTGDGGSDNQSVDVTVIVNNNGTAQLSWTPPTANTDNSTLTDLAGYKIYYGTSPGNYSQTTTVNNAGISSYTVENLSSGTWYFAISAFDDSGNESIRSNEASKTIN